MEALSLQEKNGILQNTVANRQHTALFSSIVIYSRVHENPFPSNPFLQRQTYEPSVLVHIAFSWHRFASNELHSSTSEGGKSADSFPISFSGFAFLISTIYQQINLSPLHITCQQTCTCDSVAIKSRLTHAARGTREVFAFGVRVTLGITNKWRNRSWKEINNTLTHQNWTLNDTTQSELCTESAIQEKRSPWVKKVDEEKFKRKFATIVKKKIWTGFFLISARAQESPLESPYVHNSCRRNGSEILTTFDPS